MYYDSHKSPSEFLWGLAKLELFHSVIILISTMAIVNAVPCIRPVSERPFPSVPALDSDYNRLHTVAVPMMAINAVTAGLALLAVCVDLARRKSLPLFIEVLLGVTTLVLEIATLLISFKSRFQSVTYIRGGTTAGVKGIDGKYTIEDAAAIIMVTWDIMAMLPVILIILLSLHLLWHLTVALRHLKIRPRIFLEPTPSTYPWTLRSKTSTPDSQAAQS